MPAIVNAHNEAKMPKSKATGPKQCSVSQPEFFRNATKLPAEINGEAYRLQPWEFSTGSFGWFDNGKTFVKLANGQQVQVQFSLMLTVVNSKEADRTPPADETVG